MFNVYDKESARDAYKAIKMFDEFKSEGAVKDLTDEIKREVRRWTHKVNGDSFFDGDVERRVVKEYGIDGFTELVTLPEGIDNDEYASKFFHQYVYMEPDNSMYDCTGKAFTGWYKLFKRNGRYCAYHMVCMDV